MTFNRLAIGLALIGAGFVAGVATSVAVAEREDPLIYVVDFMQVEPADKAAYERLERETWKAVHAERIERGLMRGWGLYEVRYPLGTAKPYDYATVNVYDSFEDAERDPALLFPDVHPQRSAEDVIAETRAARELVRGEIWYRLDSLGDADLAPR
jgi:transketolase C-terminal domain/subunit